MRNRLRSIPLLAALACPGTGQAVPDALSDFILVGQGSLQVFIWPVYDARLYSRDHDFAFPDTRPFLFEIRYRRAFDKAQLVAETQRQWRAMGVDAKQAWLDSLAGLLPNVDRGSVLALHVDETGNSHFYLDDSYLGCIGDPDFARAFPAIWLSAKSTRPDFRDTLLNGRH